LAAAAAALVCGAIIFPYWRISGVTPRTAAVFSISSLSSCCCPFSIFLIFTFGVFRSPKRIRPRASYVISFLFRKNIISSPVVNCISCSIFTFLYLDSLIFWNAKKRYLYN
jgi:hypothetical protein